MSLRNRILDYFKRVYYADPNVWIHKSDMERIIKTTGHLGDNGTRVMRKLVEEGKLNNRPVGKSQELQYMPSLVDIANNIDKLV